MRLSSSAPSLSAMATEGFLRLITGPLWLSLYTEKPYHWAQRCRAYLLMQVPPTSFIYPLEMGWGLIRALLAGQFA